MSFMLPVGEILLEGVEGLANMNLLKDISDEMMPKAKKAVSDLAINQIQNTIENNKPSQALNEQIKKIKHKIKHPKHNGRHHKKRG